MSFNFNMTQSMSTLDDAYACIKAWSNKIPSIICQIDEEERTLRLTILKEGSSTTVKVKDVVADHKYKWINENTSSGAPELSKHYNLKVKGKDEEGKNFIFKASLSYDSEDGSSWSGPYEHTSFSWK